MRENWLVDNSILWGWENGGYSEDDEAYQSYLEYLMYRVQSKRASAKAYNESGIQTFQRWGDSQSGKCPLPDHNGFLQYKITYGYTHSQIAFQFEDLLIKGETTKDKRELPQCFAHINFNYDKVAVYQAHKDVFREYAQKQINTATERFPNIFALIKGYNTLTALKDALAVFIKGFEESDQPFIKDIATGINGAFDDKFRWDAKKVCSALWHEPFYENLTKTITKAEKADKANRTFFRYGIDTAAATDFDYSDKLWIAVMAVNDTLYFLDTGLSKDNLLIVRKNEDMDYLKVAEKFRYQVSDLANMIKEEKKTLKTVKVIRDE